jgi:hypothetical protein
MHVSGVHPGEVHSYNKTAVMTKTLHRGRNTTPLLGKFRWLHKIPEKPIHIPAEIH